MYLNDAIRQSVISHVNQQSNTIFTPNVTSGLAWLYLATATGHFESLLQQLFTFDNFICDVKNIISTNSIALHRLDIMLFTKFVLIFLVIFPHQHNTNVISSRRFIGLYRLRHQV